MVVTKTGTTIVGLKYKTGIILCADTRSTGGPVVSDKNCEKIHYISDTIRCCGAGTAADADRVTRETSGELMRFKLKFGKEPYVAHAVRFLADYLHDYLGQLGAALVLGGIDVNGVHLYSIHPHGYSASLDFTSLGSGSLGAISELEAHYTRDMGREEAIKLGVSAVKKGILNDLYSGSNIDVCIIDMDGVKMLRNYEVVESRRNPMEIKYPPSSLEVIRETVTDISIIPDIL